MFKKIDEVFFYLTKFYASCFHLADMFSLFIKECKH